MSYVKRIVCLANSRKYSGRCIAGKEVVGPDYGPWVRPISARPSAEISEEERRYENGRDPRVLDIIDVPLIAAAPMLYQTENQVIDAGYYWTKKGELPWTELEHLVDNPATLWTNGDSTYYGLNDRVRLEIASKLTNSLALIAPENLVVRVQTEGAEFGNPRRRVRARIKHQGISYNIVVTDPVAERAFLGKPDGDYPISETKHILEDGSIESHENALCRLLRQLRLSEHDMFRSREEVIEDAYRIQGERIAYEENEPTSNVEPIRNVST